MNIRYLNLVDLSVSDIGYVINRFPDGQTGVVILDELVGVDIVEILVSFRSNSDFVELLQVVDVLRFMGIVELRLRVLYLLGARSDRRFSNSGSFDLGVYSGLINGCGFESVGICDVHSVVSLALIKNSYVYMPDLSELFDYYVGRNVILVFPDGGACDRYLDIFLKEFGDGINYMVGNKVRDMVSGSIISYDLLFNENYVGGDFVFLIIDDICDGGATFNKVCEYLIDGCIIDEGNEVHLYTTHGIYSKGLENMSLISRFWVSDSYLRVGDFVKDIESEKLNVIKL